MANKRDDDQPEQEQPQLVGFLGLGLDNDDGQKRLTRSEHFFLIGGSQRTHERMQDTAIRFSDNLKQRGKLLHEATLEEIIALFHETMED